MDNKDTLSGESRTEDEKLGRQPKKGEWAYANKKAGFWMKGPESLPKGPIAKEMVLRYWRDESLRSCDGHDCYVDMSQVAPYMDHVHALHTPDGLTYNLSYEISNDLKPGTPVNDEKDR